MIFISGNYLGETEQNEVPNIEDENSEYEMGSFTNEDEDLSISNFNSENAYSNDNISEASRSPTAKTGSLIEVKSKHNFTLVKELKDFQNESLGMEKDQTWLFSCGPPSLLQLTEEYCQDEKINYVHETYGL